MLFLPRSIIDYNNVDKRFLPKKFKPLCPSHFNIYSDKMDSTFLIIDFIPTLGGRPFCPAMSKPDNWGVTAGDKMLEQKI